MPPTDENGFLRGSCIFCTVRRKTIHKRVEPLSDCLTRDGCDAIIAAAPSSSNEHVKALAFSGVDFIAKQAPYHKSCRREFFREVEGSTKAAEMSNARKTLHAIAFQAISTLIEKEVIENNRAMLSTSILAMYRTEFFSAGGTVADVESYTVQHLMKQIKGKLGLRITISTELGPKGQFVYRTGESEDDARVPSMCGDDGKHLNEIRKAALYLRGVIRSMPKWETPIPTSVEALKERSPELPEEILV